MIINILEGEDLTLATAAVKGESWHSEKTLTVYNLREWLDSDFDVLAAANRGGFLLHEYGGTVKYQNDQNEKRKKLEQEVAEFTKSRK
jgi:hypothetical protein